MAHSNPYRGALLAAALALSGFHAAAAPTGETLTTPQQQRITDEVIHADLQMLDSLQDRIAKLNSNGVGADNYYLVKAQAWLDFARHEYYENDRSPVIEQALAQAVDLLKQMEAAKNDISLDTPVIPESQRLREDLWKLAAELKKHQGFSCAAAPLAEFEVRLVWAGHENKELGWRHAREHFAAAERLAQQARKLADNCFCPPEVKPCPMVAPVEPAPVTAQTPPPPVVVPEAAPTPPALVNVPRNIHFGLDKSDINEKAGLILGRVAELLQAYPKMTILLIGHTDSRASAAYNLKLSERRARSVMKYLEGKGIAADRMAIRAEGLNNTLSAEDAMMAHALSRRVEIAYVGEDIQSYDQTGDLVLEQIRQAKARAAQAAKAVKKGGKAKAKAKGGKKKP